MERRPDRKPGREGRPAEPEYTWGEAPGGAPAVAWEHTARPLWAQVASGQDAVLLSEKERLLLRRVSTGAEVWTRPASGPPEALAVDVRGILLAASQEVWELDPASGAERWR